VVWITREPHQKGSVLFLHKFIYRTRSRTLGELPPLENKNAIFVHLVSKKGTLYMSKRHGNIGNFRIRSMHAIAFLLLIYCSWAVEGQVPTVSPSGQPSGQPSGEPTGVPSGQPSGQPSGEPTGVPSGQPSGQPSGEPTGENAGATSSETESSPE
jgi:hypothetical protein